MIPGTGPTTDLKTVELQGLDAALLATAVAYDVTAADDRQRSVDDLTGLFFRIARALDVDLFIEAGAKDATSSREARRLLDPARVVAFEANPYTHRRFSAQHDYAADGVEYLHTALSATPGDVTFQVMTSAAGKPNADGRSSLLLRSDPGAAERVVEVTVPGTTLDAFFADHVYERSAIWVDVEGAMQPVLSGGSGTFGRAAVVIAEIEDRDYWTGQWLRADVVSCLYDCGLVPVARDFQSRYQYNIVFVQRALAEHDRVRWLLTNHLSRAAHPPKPAPSTPAPDVSTMARTADALRRVVRSARRRLRSRR